MAIALKNILIVEDEVLIAKQIQKILERNNYKSVGISVDYTSAIEKLETEPIDIVLIDININGKKTGIDLAEYINQKLKIPFLFLTSYSDSNMLSMLKECKPVSYLNKPINEATLLTNLDIYFSSDTHKENYKVPIKYGAKVFNVNLQELMYVESDHIYLNLHFTDRLSSIRLSLSKFLQQISEEELIQINRSVAINPNLVSMFRSNNLEIDNKTHKVSDKYKSNYKSLVTKLIQK